MPLIDSPKISGTFHAAVGAGYPESGSTNQSGLHWDMVCELRERPGAPGGRIEADGEVFHQNGRFLNPGLARQRLARFQSTRRVRN